MNKINFFFLILGFLGTTSLFAQEDFRKNAPEAGPAPTIELGNYEEFTLDNGLRVIAVENNKLPRVSFQLFIDIPPVKESDKAGTAEMAGQLLSRGTTTKNKATIDEAVDFIGANFSTNAQGMFGSSLTKHADKLLAIMSDVLLNPAFAEEEFEKVKTQKLSELAQSKDDPNAIAATVANVLRYGKDHPYGEIVTEATVNAITPNACKAYYEEYFKPGNAYLIIIGDMAAKDARKKAEEYFGAWEKGYLPAKTFDKPAAPANRQIDFVAKPGAVQSVVTLTYPIEFEYGKEDYVKAMLMNTLFGGFFSSRLNQNIREDKGYSYGVRSRLTADPYIGYFTSGGSVRNEVTDSTVMEFLKEMERLRTEKVPEEELSLVKNVLTGSFARSLEQPQTVARFALNTARYNLPDDFYATYLEKVSAITPEDIMAMAQKYLLPENAHVLVVGNKEEVAPNLAQFAKDGKVNFYDTDGNPLEEVAEEVPSDLTPEAILENYINAIGGADKLASVTDITASLSGNVMGTPMNMVVKRKQPGKLAMTVSANGMTMQSQKFNGEVGEMTVMGEKQPIDEAAIEGLKNQAMLFPERNYAEMGFNLSLDGIEVVEDKKAYKLNVELPSGIKTTEYYEIATGLKIRTVTSLEGVTIINDTTDYQEVDGVKLPHTLRTSGAMPVPLILSVSSYELNTDIPDAEFEIEK